MNKQEQFIKEALRQINEALKSKDYKEMELKVFALKSYLEGGLAMYKLGQEMPEKKYPEIPSSTC